MLSRRAALAAGSGLLLAGCAGVPAQAQPMLYVDGLIDGLVGEPPVDPADITAARLAACIADVSAIETVTGPDGVPRFLRSFEICDKSLDLALDRIVKYPNAYVGERGSDIGRRPGAAIFLQFQSCEPIGDDLSRIGYFHAKGLRLLQLTHHNNNLLAGGCIEKTPSGLTRLGIEGVAEMNRLRVIPDVSHASDPTALDVARVTKTPFIISHGACRAIVNHPRCAPDEVIRAVADRGGVMGVFMMSFWLTTDDVPTTEHYLAHIRHIIKVGGIDAVGVADDYEIAGDKRIAALGNDNAEGVKDYHGWWKANRDAGIPGFENLPKHAVIPELNNINRLQLIHQALERDGFKAPQIEKIMGANWIRVLRDVLG